MSKPDTKFRYFPTSHAAWAFMRECDRRGWSAGFPSLKPGPDGYSVEYTEAPGEHARVVGPFRPESP